MPQKGGVAAATSVLETSKIRGTGTASQGRGKRGGASGGET